MPDNNASFDVIVIGAGIAGASMAAELSASASVAILEREAHPAYHTSGRSAALFTINNGNPLICALSEASEPFYKKPPPEFDDYPLLTPRGVLHIAREDQLSELEKFIKNAGGADRLVTLDAQDIRRRNPLLRDGYATAAALDSTAADIDVHALLQGYLKKFKANSGQLLTRQEVRSLQRRGGRWVIETGTDIFEAGVIVNAAGAWADDIARLAGAHPQDLRPLRRTAMIVDVPASAQAMTPALNDWPMTRDIDEQFYLKPEAGTLLLSPAEETPMEPQDIQPDELDIAICIDRIQTAFDLQVTHVKRKWAGLRTFAPDRSPVVGFDPKVDGFFWLAGQGGYGFQTAPALAQLASELVVGRTIPAAMLDLGISAETISPAREAVSVFD